MFALQVRQCLESLYEQRVSRPGIPSGVEDICKGCRKKLGFTRKEDIDMLLQQLSDFIRQGLAASQYKLLRYLYRNNEKENGNY